MAAKAARLTATFAGNSTLLAATSKAVTARLT